MNSSKQPVVGSAGFRGVKMRVRQGACQAGGVRRVGVQGREDVTRTLTAATAASCSDWSGSLRVQEGACWRKPLVCHSHPASRV